MSTLETMAFLHAHGLDVEPEGLTSALRAAVETLEARYFGKPGEEGLTDTEVDVAQSGGLDAEPLDATTDPLVMGVAAYAAIVSSGLTTRQAAEHLGVSDARVRQRVHDGTLLAVRAGRAWSLPAFQFSAKGEVPGWREVCPHLPTTASPVALERWLSLPHPDLVVGEDEVPTSPRDWLLSGRPPRVVAALAGELA